MCVRVPQSPALSLSTSPCSSVQQSRIESSSRAAAGPRGGWVGVGPQWFNAGYGGMQQGIKPYASGTNSNMAPQSFNNASYPNLWSAGLEIWVCVYKGGYTYWSCNGRILGNSAFMPTSPAVPYFQRMENNWRKSL